MNITDADRLKGNKRFREGLHSLVKDYFEEGKQDELVFEAIRNKVCQNHCLYFRQFLTDACMKIKKEEEVLAHLELSLEFQKSEAKPDTIREDLAVQTGRIEFNIFDVSEFDNFDRNVVLLIHLSFDVVLLSVVHRAGDYHRAVHMWIFAESTQQLLLQKRVDCEDSWPEFWDISSAGHVSAGDTSLITA
ncbi:NUDIX hydrolase 3-like protein, partial [Tanacetum coccineum]